MRRAHRGSDVGPADRLRWLLGYRTIHWLTYRRLVLYAALTVAMYAVVSTLWLSRLTGLLEPGGTALGHDFLAFWSASWLFLFDRPELAYDAERLQAIKQMTVPGNTSQLFWFYPPTYGLIVLPLALMPYALAFGVWTAAGTAAYLWAMWRLLPRRETLIVAAAFTGCFVNLTYGQNGLVMTALFAGAALLLDSRPLLAGILFGLLSMKPQLGLLIPLALVCAAQWRALCGAAVTAGGLAIAGGLVLGWPSWEAFFHALPFAGRIIDEGMAGWFKVPTVFAGLRSLGVGRVPALIVHITAACLVAVQVGAVWMTRTSSRLKAAVLATGSLFISPYLLVYDLALLAIPIAIVAREGIDHGWHKHEREILLAAFLAPQFVSLFAEHASAPIGPIILAAVLYMCVRRVGAKCRDRACNPSARTLSAGF